MDLAQFCRQLPKVELHAHLNGSLSSSTLMRLRRLYADSGLQDKSNVFSDEFQIGAGDSVNLSESNKHSSMAVFRLKFLLGLKECDMAPGGTGGANTIVSQRLNCFQIFSIAHSLTSTTEALSIATNLTLQEFQNDGCCYVELRSTPREISHMTRRQYIETIVDAIQKSSSHLTMIAKFIVSIDRKLSLDEANEITDLAIEYHKLYPKVIVGMELSGNPSVGKFTTFLPCFVKARDIGLKISLHCGEVCNPREVQQMLEFVPERLGHGTCIHPRLGGTQHTWDTLKRGHIPVEICLTSNVKCKSSANYVSHHFKDMFEANIPVVLCTDDKGVFSTSLSEEYRMCGESFCLSPSQLARLAVSSCQYVFAEDCKELLHDKILNFINKNNL